MEEFKNYQSGSSSGISDTSVSEPKASLTIAATSQDSDDPTVSSADEEVSTAVGPSLDITQTSASEPKAKLVDAAASPDVTVNSPVTLVGEEVSTAVASDPLNDKTTQRLPQDKEK